MNKQNEINDYEVPRYVFIILIIISILGYIFGGLFYFFPYGRYIFFAIFIFSILMLFKSKKKVYKSNSVPKEMKIQYIFYTIGVLFIFASLAFLIQFSFSVIYGTISSTGFSLEVFPPNIYDKKPPSSFGYSFCFTFCCC